MKLLFLIKTLSLPGGGAERVLASVTGELAKRGHQVTVLSFDSSSSTDFYPINPQVKRIRIDIGTPDRRSGIRETMRRIFALRRIAKELRPDVAIGFMHSAFVPLSMALIGTRMPMLASEHIVFDHYRNRLLQGWLLRLAALLSDRITVISEAVRQTYPAVVARRMAVVTNPVTAPLGRADVVGGPSKVLLSVGRLEAQKDHASLIGAFGRVTADFPEWHLRIIGEGELRPDLEAQIKMAGLGDRISLPGATQSIEHEYLQVQLFVIPSSYESFGLVTAEALAHGLPAIGFADCPGTSELIRDGINGVLAQGSDRVAALADTLRTLMGSADLRRRLGDAAPATVRHFAIESIADRWEAILNSIGKPDPGERSHS